MQPATDLESQPYFRHKVLRIRAGSCWLVQQHHTGSPQLMGADLTLQLCSQGQTIGTAFLVMWVLYFWLYFLACTLVLS